MTNEIFDGHVASKLSLAEAMLEDLLPVPYYISSKIACTEQYEKLMKKRKGYVEKIFAKT